MPFINQKISRLLSTRVAGSGIDIAAVLLALATGAFWVYTLAYCYDHFGYYDWDLAMYAQAMWRLTHGSAHASLFDTNFLTNHAEYISFLLVPIYAIFRHPLTLIVFKIASFTLGGFILYRIAKDLVSPILAVTLMMMYYIYPPNLYMIFYEFHFENLAIVFIFLLYYFFRRGRFRAFVLTAVLASLVKENICLIVVMFGLYAIFVKREKRFRWSVVPLLIGGGIFYVSLFIFIPWLRTHVGLTEAGPSNYLGMYAAMGETPLEIAKTFLLKPVKVLQEISGPDDLRYLRELFAGTNIFPFLSPHVLFLAMPIFLQLLLSSSITMHSIVFHYSATLAPFIFLAVAHSFHWLKKICLKQIYPLMLLILAVSYVYYLRPHASVFLEKISSWKDPQDSLRWKLVEAIPPNAAVVTSFPFLAQLSQRDSLYSLHTIWRGRLPFTGQKSNHLPANVSYALWELNHPFLYYDSIFSLEWEQMDVFKNLSQFYFQKDWRVVEAVNHTVLLKNDASLTDKLVEITSVRADNTVGSFELLVDDRFYLLGYSIERDVNKLSSPLRFTFVWQKKNDIGEIYEIMIRLVRNEQTALAQAKIIGYALYPPLLWKKGGVIRENFWMDISGLVPGEYSVLVEIFDADGNLVELKKEKDATETFVRSFSLGNINIAGIPVDE